MKIHNLIYTLLAAIAVFLMASCSPEDFGFGKKTYSPEDLVEGKAYTVTIEGNVLKLESKISDATSLWVTPVGRSQEQQLTVELPFAGEYEVTFGVETPGGIVYGDPYKVTLSKNDFSLLSDNKWFLLADKDYKTGQELPDAATLSAGVSKKWYPCDGNYNIGRCTSPVMYCAPYDPDYDGKGYTADEEANAVYKDILFGSDNWKPNWDPGFQSWLISETDPYMDSYMTFSMDAKNGCVAKMYRGESGTKGASTGSNMVGKFNMNLTDKTKPTISFTDCYAMHNTGFDAVCSNYTQDIQIVELTPYLLQLVTKRTNSEGNWYIVWNFVSEDVIATKGACIPKEEQSLLETVSPRLPSYDNLDTDLFKTEIGGVEYVGSQMTFNLDSDAPYDFLWWNSAITGADFSKNESISKNWQSVIGGTYNDTWAPKAFEKDVEDFELVIRKSEGIYKYDCGDKSGEVKIEDGKLIFDKEISIISATSDTRSIVVKGKDFTILSLSPGESLTLGVPEAKDENGKVNTYKVANLTFKKVAAGSTGPTVIRVDNSKLNLYLEQGKYFRIELYNPWTNKEWPIDISTVKLKKNQTLSMTFKIEGLTWNEGAKPKAVLCQNIDEVGWETGCFDLPYAVEFNKNGETTVTWQNTTGSTATFSGTSCITMTLQLDGFGSAPLLDDGNLDTDKVKVAVTSLTIQ